MVISVASQKGRTGKTTTALSLAVGLAQRGKRVLLIDMDSQAHASRIMLKHYPKLQKRDTIYVTILEQEPIPIQETELEGLFVAASDISLDEFDLEILKLEQWFVDPCHSSLSEDDRELIETKYYQAANARLKSQLDEIKDDYDEIIIDCPPTLPWLTVNAFAASDKVLVVVSPGYYELDSIVEIGKIVQSVQQDFDVSFELQSVLQDFELSFELLGFLFTMSDSTVNSKTSLELLRQAYPNNVFKTVIPRNIDIQEAEINGQDIFSYSPQSKSAEAYRQLIDEIYE